MPHYHLSRRVVSSARYFRWVVVWIGIVVGVALLGDMYAGYVGRPHRERAELYHQQAMTAVQYGDSLLEVVQVRDERIRGLTEEVMRIKATIPALRGRTDSLRTVADSLYAELSDSVLAVMEVIPAQRALIVQQDSVIQQLLAVSLRQDVLLLYKDSTIFDLTAAVDSMRTVLRLAPEPVGSEKLFGLIPLPNRTTTLLVGGVLGGFLTLKAGPW